MEPDCKRRRTGEMDPFAWEMVPVLSGERSRDVELVAAYAAPIFNKKETSRLIKLLAEVYPLSHLPHIKRVRASGDRNSDHPLEILVCLGSDAGRPEGKPSLADLLPEGWGGCSGLGEPFQVLVPAKPAVTRPEFEAASRHWPTAFHENKRATEALVGGQPFNAREKAAMLSFMGKALGAARAGKEEGMEAVGAVVVDPANDQIIAVGHDLRHGPNPLLHAVMVCVDLVAHGQGGGAFDHSKYPNCVCVAAGHKAIDIGNKPRAPPGDTGSGGEGNNKPRAPPGDTGSGGEGNNKPRAPPGDTGSGGEGNNKPRAPPGDTDTDSGPEAWPYICTGYDLYVSREPCVMCAMALVHSRIHRVFYATATPDGALGTRYQIHTKNNLNHHYQVFKGLMETECRRTLAQP